MGLPSTGTGVKSRGAVVGAETDWLIFVKTGNKAYLPVSITSCCLQKIKRLRLYSLLHVVYRKLSFFVSIHYFMLFTANKASLPVFITLCCFFSDQHVCYVN